MNDHLKRMSLHCGAKERLILNSRSGFTVMFTNGTFVSIIVGRSSTHEDTLPAILATKWINLSKSTTAIRLIQRAFRAQSKAPGNLIRSIMLLLA